MKNREEGIIIADPGIISRFHVEYVENKTQFLDKKISFFKPQPLNFSTQIVGLVHARFKNCYLFADEISTAVFAYFENGKISKIADGFLFNNAAR